MVICTFFSHRGPFSNGPPQPVACNDNPAILWWLFNPSWRPPDPSELAHFSTYRNHGAKWRRKAWVIVIKSQ
jgi:hypothetical protein